MNETTRRPLGPGARAPEFVLDAVDREGRVSLSDYRGRRALLLALFRGLWCPFSRKAISGLPPTAARLREMGVETLAVVATSVENARLYFRFRPAAVPLAADPELATHRLFGLPGPGVSAPFLAALAKVRVNPTGELPEPLPLTEIGDALDRLHGFHPTHMDRADADRQLGLLKGQFLLDRDGVVRWSNVECSGGGLEGMGRFPTEEELLEAARGVAEA